MFIQDNAPTFRCNTTQTKRTNKQNSSFRNILCLLARRNVPAPTFLETKVYFQAIISKEFRIGAPVTLKLTI